MSSSAASRRIVSRSVASVSISRNAAATIASSDNAGLAGRSRRLIGGIADNSTLTILFVTNMFVTIMFVTNLSPPSARTMWLILLLVLVADALDLIDATITNIAAPTIVRDIGGGESLVKWLSASYALSLGTLLVVGGRLGDRYGQRKLFLIGMAGFTAASALCGLALDPALLIVSRALQGVFGALLIPQGMAIMTKTFPKDMLAKAFGAFGPLLGIAAVGGPILGGFIIDADLAGLSWRPMFLINVGLGIAGLIVAIRVLPRDVGNPEATVDVLGALWLGAGMLGLLYGLIDGSDNGWTALPIACLIVAAAAFAGFAHRLRTAAAPLLKPVLLRNRGFTSGLAIGVLYFAAINGLMYVVSLFMQLGLDYDPSRTALGLLPVTIGIMIGAGSAMALVTKLGRRLVVIGLTITLAGALGLLAVVTAGTVSTVGLSAALLVIGAGAGVSFGTIFNTALGDVDPDEAGAASGSLSSIQQIASALGTATVTTVYFAAVADSGQEHAIELSLFVVLGIAAACLAVVRLLPRRAVALEH